jgi:methionyl-tRNA synthetase
MGKDNVAFHTVSFPATLLGSGEPWKTVDMLKSFNWLNWYGGKFSTSGRRGVFMDQALQLLPADYWRWYLTANAPEGSDTAFTWEQFATAVNKDLADVLGNFVNRIARFAETRFDARVPDGGEPGPLEQKLYGDLTARLAELTAQMEGLELRKSAQSLRAIWGLGNEYLAEAAPWTVIKTDPVRAGMIVRTGLNLAALFARLSHPFIPFTAEKIIEALAPKTEAAVDVGAWPTGDVVEALRGLPPGAPIRAPDVLFNKIDGAQVAAWTERFGGADTPFP